MHLVKPTLLAVGLVSTAIASPVDKRISTKCGFVNVFYEPTPACQVATAAFLNAVLGNSASLKVPTSGEGKSACVDTIGDIALSFEMTVNGQIPSDCKLHYYAQTKCVGGSTTSAITPLTCINGKAQSFQLVC